MHDYCQGKIIYLIYKIDEITREAGIEERRYHNTVVRKLMKQNQTPQVALSRQFAPSAHPPTLL